MHRTSRLVALLLAVALPAALPSAQAMAVPAAGSGHPAGCHDPAPTIPSPAPSNYQCCVSGHHWAMPNGSFSPDPTMTYVVVAAVQGDLPELVSHLPVVQPVIPCNSPPGAAPLRI